MHRDFQSRNIMVKGEKVSIIDFQGGMMGLPAYDLVSLIWQARANLSASFKQELKTFYFNTFNKTAAQPFTKDSFELQYELCLIIRLLQVLGAYGFRGIYERKPQFIESIQQGIENLTDLIDLPIMKEFPYLEEIIFKITQLPKQKIKAIVHANH